MIALLFKDLSIVNQEGPLLLDSEEMMMVMMISIKMMNLQLLKRGFRE
jgi:hypothetical protein